MPWWPLQVSKAQQAQERLAARSAYSSGCGDCGGQHVVVNELGYPIRPERFSDQFQKMSVAAGLPVIRLTVHGIPAAH